MSFEREFFGYAGWYLACRLFTFGGQVDHQVFNNGDHRGALDGLRDAKYSMMLLCGQALGRPYRFVAGKGFVRDE